MVITFKDGEAMLYSIDAKNILQQRRQGEKEKKENLIILKHQEMIKFSFFSFSPCRRCSRMFFASIE